MRESLGVSIDEVIDTLSALVGNHVQHLLILLALFVQCVYCGDEGALFEYTSGELQVLIVNPSSFSPLGFIIQSSLIA